MAKGFYAYIFIGKISESGPCKLTISKLLQHRQIAESNLGTKFAALGVNFAFYLFIPSAPGIVLQHLQTSNSFRKIATSNHANFRCLDLTKTNFSKLKYFCKAADAAICQNIALQGGCHNFFA